jgi:transcriptional regulator with XRE-family HTH domain
MMQGTMRPQASDKIGAAIRKLRMAKGWTLAELSEQCGVPLSTLSRVELGQNALNYEKLVRLCHVLDIDLQGLVAREAEGAFVPSGRRSVVRAGQGEPVTIGNQAGRKAAADLLSKALSPVVLELTVSSLSDHGPLRVLGGEAYLHVLTGTAVLHSDLYAPLTLGAGDAVYFDGRSPYAILAAPGGTATALLVAAGDEGF